MDFTHECDLGKDEDFELGLDFAFLNNKFSVSADYFIQKTEDMLLSMPQSLSFWLEWESYSKCRYSRKQRI